MNQTDMTSRIYHIYRLGLSGILLATYLVIDTEFLENIHAPALFFTTSLSWFFAAAITSFSSYLSRKLDWLSSVNCLIDMVALSILGWASGGLAGGIFFLMLPTAAMAGLTLPFQLALLIASAATLGTLSAQTLLIFDSRLPSSAYFSSGVLGIMLFLTTMVSSLLARRISVSDARATQNRLVAESYLKLNETIIERMQTGLLAIDSKQQIKMANLAAQQMLKAGLSNSSLIGQHLSQFPKFFNAYEHWIENPMNPIRAFTHSYSGVSIQVSFGNLRSGDQVQTLAWLEDTRTIRQRAQQIKYESLSKLSSGLAHEVRNPLSAVQQANDLLLQSSDLSESDKQLTEVIERHCLRMNDIIEVVQQLSRNVEPRFDRLDLGKWLPEFIDEFQETQADSSTIDTDIEAPGIIYFDTRHLKQVLTNLIENGLRHSAEVTGSLYQYIEARYSENKQMVYIDLHDKGPGINHKDQRKIFDPFYSTATGGSGLGLYLAREFCESNYASINYLYENETQASGFFRITCCVELPRN